LVVCGGQTERIYFDTFKQVFRPSLGNINIVTALKAKNPMQIVEYAMRIRQQKEGYNAVWCVFDKDDFNDFDEAIVFAKRNGIGTAFSNQAFEVWFINHFRLLNSPLSRNKYKDELSKRLAFPYEKTQDSVTRVCSELLVEELLKTAMANSRLGYESHISLSKAGKPSEFESCTTVYRLIKSLLKWTE
jgi:hypothetical protein